MARVSRGVGMNAPRPNQTRQPPILLPYLGAKLGPMGARGGRDFHDADTFRWLAPRYLEIGKLNSSSTGIELLQFRLSELADQQSRDLLQPLGVGQGLDL